MLRNNIDRRRPIRNAIDNTAIAISGASMIAVELAEMALDELRAIRYANQLENDAELRALEEQSNANEQEE
jgi:hypothetical protein